MWLYLISMVGIDDEVQLCTNISTRKKNGQDVEFVENTVQKFHGQRSQRQHIIVRGVLLSFFMVVQ